MSKGENESIRKTEDEALLLEGFTAQGIVTFYLGNSSAAAHWLDRAIGLYDRDHHQSLTYAYGIEPGVHIGVYAIWHAGSSARASEHPHLAATNVCLAS